MSSGHWHFGPVSFGRLAVRLNVYRHRYPSGPDRWVAQPSVIYDRKRAAPPNKRKDSDE